MRFPAYPYLHYLRTSPNISSALQTAPTYFSFTYERELALSEEQWLARLASPLKNTLVALSSDENQEEEWVGTVTFIAPEGVKGMKLQLPCDAEPSFPVFGMWLGPNHCGKGLRRKLMEEGLRWERKTWESSVPEERYADMQVVLECVRII